MRIFSFGRAAARVKIPVFTIVGVALLFVFDFSAYTALTFAAAGLHELAHVAAMLSLGKKIECVTIYPFGADIRTSGAILSHGRDMTISAAGVVANIVAATLFFAFGRGIYAFYFALCNAALAAFNAMPVRGLDGGETLRAFLSMVAPLDTAEKICDAVSCAVLILMWTGSILLPVFGIGNASLFAVCSYMFFSIFAAREKSKDFGE